MVTPFSASIKISLVFAGLGVGLAVGDGEADASGLDEGVGEGDADGFGEAVGTGMTKLAVGEGLGVALGVGDGEAVADGLADGVADALADGERPGDSEAAGKDTRPDGGVAGTVSFS